MATVATKKSAPKKTRRDSLSTFMGLRPDLIDKTQGIHDSDYKVNSRAALNPKTALLDNFNWAELEGVDFLASGAFSHCFQANYKGQKVVAKILREQYKDSTVTTRQMRFEQVLLSQLKHDHIVEFIGTGVQDGTPFTVLEKLDQTLNQKMTGDEKLSMLDILTYVRQVGDALIYLHESAIAGQITLHRDLKPDNLAFGYDGKLKLIDFGLAKSIPRGRNDDEVYEMTGETGSLRYMAPEVALGMPYNAKADVYSLALITWQMAQGTKPFQGMSRKDYFHHVVHRNFRPPIDSKWPEPLQKLIVRSWDPDHSKRPTAREYTAVIDGILASMQRHARRGSTGNPVSLLRSAVNMLIRPAEEGKRRDDGAEYDERKETTQAPEPESTKTTAYPEKTLHAENGMVNGAGGITPPTAVGHAAGHRRRNSV